MNRKGFSLIIVLLVVGVVLIGGAMWYYEAHLSSSPQSVPNPASTADLANTTSVLNMQSPTVISTSVTSSGMSLTEATRTTRTVPAVSTSGWLTYADAQDGFSFQYPSDCALSTSTYDEIGIIIFYNCHAEGLVIDLYHNHSDQSVLDFWRSTTGLVVVSSTPMTVHGYSALQIQDQMAPFAEGDQVATSYLLVMNNALIVGFAPSPFDTLTDNNDPIPKAILNTLR